MLINNNFLKYSLFRLLNPVLTCPFCLLPTTKLICNTCYNELEIITKKQCTLCGKPLDLDKNHECIAKPNYIDHVYSQFIYATPLNKLLHELKYKKKLNTIWQLGYLLNQTLTTAIHNSKIDFIIPMPISSERLSSRGFNQVELLLAYYIAKNNQIPVRTNLVSKVIDTPHQTMVQKSDRLNLGSNNLSDIFSVNNNIVNKNILIVDDVITTGSTANTLAYTLKSNGANTVILTSLMRTLA